MVLAGNKAKRLSSISHTTKTIYQFTPKLISRIGRSEDNKKKPIKVELQKELDKEKILTNLRNLKSNIEYKGISITEDYTTSERQMLKHSNWKTQTSMGSLRNSKKRICIKRFAKVKVQQTAQT